MSKVVNITTLPKPSVFSRIPAKKAIVATALVVAVAVAAQFAMNTTDEAEVEETPEA